jgi:hypothetical protein
MFSNFKNMLSRAHANSKGWRSDKRIVVIESDDWGSIRMPNKQTRDKFSNMGYAISSNPYCNYDTLANEEDLTKLFSVLLKYKDKNGNPPSITANTVVANPDFEAIRNSNYLKYSYKPFTTTLEEYYPKKEVFALWKEGIVNKIFIPQYHGREHLNSQLWLDLLRNDNKIFIDAFDMGFWGLPKNSYNENIFNIQAAYGSAKNKDITYFKNSIDEGLNLFENIFKYKSKTFIANNYTWSPLLHQTLKENGVIGLQGMKYQKVPTDIASKVKLIPIYTGKKTDIGQVYMVRNCMFEPSQMPVKFNNIKNCLNEIENAFLFKKPAIITSHRLNFIGAIDQENRNRNLAMLDELLKRIFKKWPDVTFMNSEQLANHLHTNS